MTSTDFEDSLRWHCEEEEQEEEEEEGRTLHSHHR